MIDRRTPGAKPHADSPVSDVCAARRFRRLARAPPRSRCRCAVVFVGSLALFLWGLDAARDLYFDETWYVPTARALLEVRERCCTRSTRRSASC